MKKVVSNQELYNYMQEAINLLCDNVKITMGPKGNNVIIDHSAFSPFITNDGVTIAENIASENEVVNTILELAKEAAINTNEKVGDGTTTTLVLLQSIFNTGLKLVKEGINPIILKKELDNTLNEIVEQIQKISRTPSKEEIKLVASVSSNDNEIGQIVSEAYLQVLDKSAITIKEYDQDKCMIRYLKGYRFSSLLASPYFLNGLESKEFFNSYMMLYNGYLSNLEIVSEVINRVNKLKKDLIIIANDYDDLFIQNILEYNLENNEKVILLKTPEFGIRQIQILQDLSAISNSNIINNQIITMNDINTVEKVTINNNEVIINFKFNDQVKKLLINLNEDLKNTITEKDFIQKRLTMLEKGSVEILVGAKTITERREKKMRFDDALCAVAVAYEGILPGMGLILSKISSVLTSSNNGAIILKEALLKPLEQILINAGLDYNTIFSKIKLNDYQILYNVKKDKFEDIVTSEVIDPTLVVINSLTSAVSIAGMLLTTKGLVINEYQNNINQVTDFNEV